MQIYHCDYERSAAAKWGRDIQVLIRKRQTVFYNLEGKEGGDVLYSQTL